MKILKLSEGQLKDVVKFFKLNLNQDTSIVFSNTYSKQLLIANNIGMHMLIQGVTAKKSIVMNCKFFVKVASSMKRLVITKKDGELFLSDPDSTTIIKYLPRRYFDDDFSCSFITYKKYRRMSPLVVINGFTDLSGFAQKITTTEKSRYDLDGVCVNYNDLDNRETSTLESTDGRTLLMSECNITYKDKSKKVWIDGRQMKYIHNFMKMFKDMLKCQFHDDETNTLIIDTHSSDATAPLYALFVKCDLCIDRVSRDNAEKRFPDCKRLLDMYYNNWNKGHMAVTTFQNDELLEVIKKMCAIADIYKRNTSVSLRIAFENTVARLKITDNNNEDAIIAMDVVDNICSKNIDCLLETEVVVNLYYLKRIVDGIKHNKYMRMHLLLDENKEFTGKEPIFITSGSYKIFLHRIVKGW